MTSATKRARWCGGSASRSLTVRLRVASSSTVVHFRVMPRVSHTVDVSTEASLRQAASGGGPFPGHRLGHHRLPGTTAADAPQVHPGDWGAPLWSPPEDADRHSDCASV